MNNYFSQFIPQLGNRDSRKSNRYLDVQHQFIPKLSYITIFNPTFIDEKSESNEELFKQILCFISARNEESAQELDLVEQVKTIGLIRGIDSFVKNFHDDEKKGANILKLTKSTTIIKEIESGYYICCSISLPIEEDKLGSTNAQMIKLINEAYNFFVILNKSFNSILQNYNLDVLKSLLNEYWSGFLVNYNSENFKFPPTLKWFNSLNYKGFLGLLPNSNERTYKKSSLSLSYTTRSEIDQILQADNNEYRLLPKGLIISYFNKMTPKEYGMIYMNNIYDEEIRDGIISKNSMIDIYNWLEYYDYHNKLDTDNLINVNMNDIFSPSKTVGQCLNTENNPSAQQGSNDDADVRSIQSTRSTTASAFEMFNPINLTNNLVISPLNYTVNSMMSLSGINSSNNDPSERSSWLTVPPILKQFGINHGESTTNLPVADRNESTRESEIEEPEEQEDQGQYLIGLKKNKLNNDGTIYRKLVYLKTMFKDDNNEKFEEEREYSLILFEKHDIYITLIYDSSIDELDKVEFYNNLLRSILIPSNEEIHNFITGGSMLGNSVGSLASLNDIINSNQVHEGTINNGFDNNFFFIIYDAEEGWIKSSLPYLSIQSIGNSGSVNKVAIKYQSAMFYLHDKLTNLFITLKNKEFFQNYKPMDEYFHKFNSNKSNDWMFYYIKHHDKFIIIVKNHNHSFKTSGNNRKSVSMGSKKSVLINSSSPPTIASELNQAGILRQIADGVTEYAHLGFVDNLGDDVKLWLENFSISGDP